MNILIKNTLVLDQRSPYYNQLIDFVVSDGIIVKIGNNLQEAGAEIVEGKKLVLSTAFVDINTTSGEPNQLESESLESLISSGARGGFAYLCHLPNAQRSIQSKSDVVYLQSLNQSSACKILPVGNITQRDNEQVLSAMMDMRTAGAIAYSDGNESSLKINVLKNALLYSKGFGGKLMIHPEKTDLSKQGQINQGAMSIQLGYRGIPHEAETLAVNEIVNIAEYTDSELLLLNLTMAQSIKIVGEYNKTNSRKIKTSTSSLHLSLDENNLLEYDSFYKINPPLRTSKNKKELIKAAIEGKIDIVYSQHTPCTTEEKDLEFDQASFGAINLQTSFLSLLQSLGVDNIEACIKLHSTNPAEYLGIDLPVFDQNSQGSFTLIELEDEFELSTWNNVSKSKNSPYFGHKFKGKIKGLIAHQYQTIFN